MRKSLMRILCAMLALVLLASNIPVVFAAEDSLDVSCITLQTQTNPLYDGLITQPILTYSRKLYSAGETGSQIIAKCTEDYDQIVTTLTEGMENRESAIVLYFAMEEPLYTSAEENSLSDKEFNDLINERWIMPLLEDAFVETDSPTQGDSLRWHWHGCGSLLYACYDQVSNRYCYKTVLNITYYTTKAQEDQLTEAVTDVVESFNFTSGTTNVQKITAIYDYITSNVRYDYDNLEDENYTLKYSAYAAMINKTAVCQGYALLFYRMAEMCGVDTRVISGYAGGPHAWNISKVNNYYYNLDSTWDEGRANYNYFLCGSMEFSDHFAAAEYKTPAFRAAYPISITNYSNDATVNHVYSNDCDTTCNICGIIRQADDHLYDHACDADCNRCGSVREVGDHVYDNDCDTNCNLCGEVREASEHVYDNACDSNCNICGAIREAEEHDYDNACDPSCNNCGATRTTSHNFTDATCTTLKICTVCGAKTGSVLGHSYDNACDASCNRCGATRATSHDYANATCTEAAICTVCGATTGSALGHSYVNATCTTPKTCTVCGVTTGNALGHSYDNACDASCNRCSTTRTTTHKYNSGKVTKAATCKATGVKTYTCSVCKGTKTATIAKLTTHTYTNACDTICNVCSAKRTIKHTYKTTVTKATLKKNGKEVKACTVCGKVSKETTIYKIKTVKLSTTEYTYNGKKKTPSVTVKDSKGNKLKKGTDYTVTYDSGRKKVGEYEVKIKFKGDYSGSKTLTFEINPKGTTVKSLTAKSKALKVTLKKQTTQTTGYQIQYSTDKDFDSAKKVTISSNKTTSKTIKSLKKGKKYYVRVRTYKSVDGTKYYSSWSKAKSAKVK